MNNKKNNQYFIFGIVILVAVIGFILYQYLTDPIAKFNFNKITNPEICDRSATTSDCIDIPRKTYRNPRMGLSFQYPENMFIVESATGVVVTQISPLDPKRQSSAMMGALSMSLLPGATMEKATETIAETTLSSENISVNEYSASRLTSVPDEYSGSKWVSIFVETEKGVLEIKYMQNSLFAKTYEEIIDGINVE